MSPTTVASCSGGALLVQLDLDHLLGVVPRAAGVRHVDGLEQADHRDRDQVGDEEHRVEERVGERQAEDHDEDVEHAGLRVLGADLAPPSSRSSMRAASAESSLMFFLMYSTAR